MPIKAIRTIILYYLISLCLPILQTGLPALTVAAKAGNEYKIYAQTNIMTSRQSDVNGEPTVKKVEIAPLQRAIFYFTYLPESYESNLSADKKKITIRIKNADLAETSRKISSIGIIREIYLQSSGKDVEIYIILRDKRGYTTTSLPFSRAIAVDVFEWSSLTPDEDSFKMGLLALEKGLDETAKNWLEKSAKSNSKDASSILGIIELKKGNITSAIENITHAAQSNTTILDVYAAIAQIYNLAGQGDKALQFEKYFKLKTGLDDFQEIVINNSSEARSLKKEPSLFIEKLNSLIIHDSLFYGSQSLANKSKDTAFSNLFNSRMSNVESPKSIDDDNSILPEWLPTVIIISIVAIILIGVIIGAAYLRWRKSRQSVAGRRQPHVSNGDVTKNKFENALYIAQNKAYQTRQPIVGSGHYNDDENSIIKNQSLTNEVSMSTKGSMIDRTIEDSDNNFRKNAQASTGNTGEKIITGESQKEKLMQVLTKLTEESPAEGYQSSTVSEKSRVENDELSNENGTNKFSPKQELMIKLQRAHQNERLEKIEKMKNSDKPTDNESLTESARELRIEKGIIETKNAIKGFKNDEDRLRAFKEKFN